MILCSFDIFDTTLLRKCGTADNFFWILASRLFPNDEGLQFKFVNWRLSTAINCDSNYSLDDLYSKWDSELFGGLTSEFVKESEMGLESEMLIANKDVLKLIDNHRKQGGMIVFISDMYLNSRFLERILRREGAFMDGDCLYVSNECKARKDTGLLYDYVEKIYSPTNWVHYGDNKVSDCVIPKGKGIEAHQIKTDYSKLESYLVDLSSLCVPEWQLSVLAGLCRIARNQFGNTAEAILAADFVAPFLIPYVKFILDNAKRRGLKTLFFVARDGYILMKLAESLPHKGIQLKFLFVSRKSLQPSFLRNVNKVDFLNLFEGRSLRGKRVKDIFSVIGMEYNVLDQTDEIILSKEREEEIVDLIFDKTFYSKWQIKIKRSADLIVSYLSQEGVLGDDIALVDVGWYGTTRMMINHIRNRKGKSDCFNYYWGIQDNALGVQYGDYECFIHKVNKDPWVTFLLEDYFLSSPYPSTIGYENGDNKIIVPQFKDGKAKTNNPYFNTNLQIAQFIQDIINDYDFSPEILKMWSKATLSFLTSDDCQVDLSPFFQICSHDTFSVRKLKLNEVIRYIKGNKITTNDLVSLDYTFGYHTRNRIMKMRNLYQTSRKILKNNYLFILFMCILHNISLYNWKAQTSHISKQSE